MKMLLLNIAPFFPERVAYMAEEALRLWRVARIDSPAYCMTLHPVGDEPLAKARRFAAAFAQLQERLAGTPVRAGILVQAIMGHGWKGQRLCGPDWATTIDIDGQTTYRMCPLDPGFRDYTRQVFAMLAKCRPAFILTDDDIRLISSIAHDKGLQCFCRHHMAAFNAVAPRPYEAAELQAHLRQAPPGDEIAVLFDRVRRESLLGFARLIREAIDEVDPDIPCGACAGSREYVNMAEMARTLAGKNTPFLRIANAMYLERSILDYPLRQYHTNLMRSAAEDIPILLDEADTCPHNRFSKSAAGLHAHIVGGILNGLNGAKLWMANIKEPEPEESRRYEEVVGGHRGFYDGLLELCHEADWLGPRTILPDKEQQWRPAHISPYYIWNEWQWTYMMRFGIPGSYGAVDATRTTLLTGPQVRALPLETLRIALAGSVLLDGDGAFAMHERGLGEFIGTAAEHGAFRATCEVDCELRRPMPFLNDFTAPILKPLPQARALSEFRLEDEEGGFVTTGVGSVYYENGLGGRVVTVALSMSDTIYNMLKPVRKAWLLLNLRRLSGRPLPYCADNQNLYFRYGRLRDGSHLAAVVNLSFDKLEEIRLAATDASEAELLLPDGGWQRLAASREGDILRLPVSLETYGCAILRLRA